MESENNEIDNIFIFICDGSNYFQSISFCIINSKDIKVY